MNEQTIKNQYVSELFRTAEDYSKPPFSTKVDGDVYACTVPGIGVEPGWVVTDKDGRAYRRSAAIVAGDPMALFIQLGPVTEPAPAPPPPAHESSKHNRK